MKKKLCPLNNRENCYEERCAWWVKDVGCAPFTIMLYHLKEQIMVQKILEGEDDDK